MLTFYWYNPGIIWSQIWYHIATILSIVSVRIYPSSVNIQHYANLICKHPYENVIISFIIIVIVIIRDICLYDVSDACLCVD